LINDADLVGNVLVSMFRVHDLSRLYTASYKLKLAL